MAEEKTIKIEREYIVPLRRRWLLVPGYRRAGKAARTLKIFIAKHMKVADRDVKNVRLDTYLNNELWFRGVSNPPSKIKVKAVKEGDIVRVYLAEIPEQVKFAKLKHEKFHSKEAKKPAEKAKEAKEEKKAETTEEEKAEKVEEKKAEVEKEKAGAEKAVKEAKIESKAEKHITQVKEEKIFRKALKR